jgi:hypothetical protein
MRGSGHNARWFKTVSNNFKLFLTHSNLIRSKHDLLELKNFEIKYGFEGFNENNNFPYRNFLRFEINFELKIREASRV